MMELSTRLWAPGLVLRPAVEKEHAISSHGNRVPFASMRKAQWSLWQSHALWLAPAWYERWVSWVICTGSVSTHREKHPNEQPLRAVLCTYGRDRDRTTASRASRLPRKLARHPFPQLRVLAPCV